MDARHLLPAALLAAISSTGAAAVELADGWVRAAPPGASAYAGFIRIVNDESRTLRVRACSSGAFAVAELHRTRIEGGVAVMRRLEELRVAAGETAVLEPGGMHLMLMQPAIRVEAGTAVPICLEVDGARLEFEVPVRHGDGENGDRHHGH